MIQNDLIFYIFVMSIVYGFINIASLFILIKFLMNKRSDAAKKEIEEREKTIMRLLIIITLVTCVGTAQDEFYMDGDDEDPIITIIDEKPLVFPEELPKAAKVLGEKVDSSLKKVDYSLENDLWVSSAYAFLRGDDTDLNFASNNTINLTELVAA